MPIKKIVQILVIFVLTVEPAMAAEEYRRKDWRVETQGERVFYLTNGTVKGNHEFGFFKDPGICQDDVLWLTFSSPNEDVVNFKEHGVVVTLRIDKKDFILRPVMTYVGKMDSAYIMMFTNWVPSTKVIRALEKGRFLKLKITGPATFESLLDIKEEDFSLMGFKATRRKARKICKEKK